MKNLKFIALLLKFNKNEEYAELYGAENKIFILVNSSLMKLNVF